jgi:hypothetical protein
VSHSTMERDFLRSDLINEMSVAFYVVPSSLRLHILTCDRSLIIGLIEVTVILKVKVGYSPFGIEGNRFSAQDPFEVDVFAVRVA